MMTLPIARTRDEVRLFLDLTPCECGALDADWKHGTGVVDGELASVYDASCADCGAEREYFFGLPERESGGDYPNFGDSEPSQLLDPGRWLELADQLASMLPPDDPETRAEALAIAAAAVVEAMKFIPPDADAVPAEAFWTEQGRRMYDEQPGRFQRARLQVVRETYEQAATQ